MIRTTMLTLGFVLVLSGCSVSVSPGEFAADAAAQAERDSGLIEAAVSKVLPIASDDLRPLRACLLVAGFGEVAAEKAKRGQAKAGDVLGHLLLLDSAVKKAKDGSKYWRNTLMARAAIEFGSVAIGIARNKVVKYLEMGPSIETGLVAAKSVAIDVVMIPALVRDVKGILKAVEDKTLTEAQAWDLCTNSITASKERLAP